MTVFVAWSPAGFDDELVGEATGPWHEVRRVADEVLLVDADETLSKVYHHLKWSLPEDAPLLVVPSDGPGKNRGLPAGTTSWLRARPESLRLLLGHRPHPSGDGGRDPSLAPAGDETDHGPLLTRP